MSNEIVIQGAHLHNLKHINLTIPKNRLIVITGLSGSGKSTLAMDTLFREGLRQYFESIGIVTFGLSKPEVDKITGLSPTISVDQHMTNRSPRSTVGTATEVFTYLRLLFARIGNRVCLNCGGEIPPAYDVGATADDAAGETTYPCPHCGVAVPNLTMAHFSFNKPEGACPTCSGLGVVMTADLEQLLDPSKSIREGGVVRWERTEISRYSEVLQAAGQHFGFPFDPNTPLGELGEVQMDLLLYGATSDQFRRHVPDIEPPELVSKGRFEGVVPNLLRRYAESSSPSYRARLGKLIREQTCPDCQGARLRPESRAVVVNGRTIIELSKLPLTSLQGWVAALEAKVQDKTQQVAAAVIIDLRERLRRLLEVGVGYLTLERAMPSVSGGEAMRLRLASLLGSSLTGILYVLDEPTIGLHPRDNAMLIKVLRRLRDLGNTVLVIEHDLDMIRAADVLIDMGPGAGQHGGKVVAMGSPAEVAHMPESITGQYLSGAKKVAIPAQRRPGNGHTLTIHGARAYNLKNLTVELPLGTLIGVIGASGSGKSSLILDILGRAAERRYHQAQEIPADHDTITGWEHLSDVVTIDQTAIGRSPRSNAATYTDIFTSIRQTFASLPEAHHLDPRHFSFNVPGGRCEGAGVLTVSMQFMPSVEVRCPVCQGRRFKDEVLQVKYRGYDIAQVLDSSIEEALELFAEVPAVARKLQLLADVGLGYLKLGQPATMLSGGEAQRIKLAKELGRRSSGHTLYLLDEPTTGQHPDDTGRLLAVLQRLVDADNTVLVIEHNVEMIRAADWLIELGPEGGEAGGYLIAAGTPEEVAANPNSPTAPFLVETHGQT